MMGNVRFHPAALDDADEAAAWYSRRSARAAIRFLDELDEVIESIAAHPQQFPLFESTCRRALFRRYPFFIVFQDTDDGVIVLAVAHAKRRPRFWLDRS